MTNLCIVKTLNEYLEKTKDIWKSNALVITSISPYHKATKATIARWVKNVLKASRINHEFKPHSIRAASTLKADKKGVKLNQILDAAG